MADLHPQLARDTIEIGKFKLCRLLLMNDANYPWFIMVPDRDNISEIFQLSENDQQLLTEESDYLSKTLYKIFSADKLNIAALGNIVPQLHIHHIVRFKNDPAWPNPVWGSTKTVPYSETALSELKNKIVGALKSKLVEIE